LYDYFNNKNIRDFTAFVRIDKQIKDLFGDYLYVLNLLPKSDFNVELGWHPHFYDGIKVQKDSNIVIRELYELYYDCESIRNMKSVRIGGGFMDNNIMSVLNNLNFAIDSSCMPACKRDDDNRKYDWSSSGNNAYYPFIYDYQTPGDPHLGILEIPMTTILIPAPYDNFAKRRYINPAIRKEIFQPAFSRYCHFLPYIVLTFHPDQLIEGYEDDLYKYGMDNFISNMEFIEKEVGDVTYKSLSKCHTKS
jgi:hypothetical protein